MGSKVAKKWGTSFTGDPRSGKRCFSNPPRDSVRLGKDEMRHRPTRSCVVVFLFRGTLCSVRFINFRRDFPDRRRQCSARPADDADAAAGRYVDTFLAHLFASVLHDALPEPEPRALNSWDAPVAVGRGRRRGAAARRPAAAWSAVVARRGMAPGRRQSVPQATGSGKCSCV